MVTEALRCAHGEKRMKRIAFACVSINDLLYADFAVCATRTEPMLADYVERRYLCAETCGGMSTARTFLIRKKAAQLIVSSKTEG